MGARRQPLSLQGRGVARRLPQGRTRHRLDGRLLLVGVVHGSYRHFGGRESLTAQRARVSHGDTSVGVTVAAMYDESPAVLGWYWPERLEVAAEIVKLVSAAVDRSRSSASATGPAKFAECSSSTAVSCSGSDRGPTRMRSGRRGSSSSFASLPGSGGCRNVQPLRDHIHNEQMPQALSEPVGDERPVLSGRGNRC